MPFDLLPALREHLIGEGLVREPNTAGAEPVMWLERMLGTPAPGEAVEGASKAASDLVVGAYRATGFPPARYEGLMRRDAVELIFRCMKSPPIFRLEEAIRTVTNDRRAWEMGGLQVYESLIFRDLQRLGSDEQGFTFSIEYTFQRYQDHLTWG